MRSEREIDDAIDCAVRDIMNADPPRGFRNRVLMRLERRTSWMTLPRLAPSAAALALVALAASFLTGIPAPQPPAAPTLARAADPAPPNPAPSSPESEKPAASTPDVKAPSSAPPAGSGVTFPPPGTVAAASVLDPEAGSTAASGRPGVPPGVTQSGGAPQTTKPSSAPERNPAAPVNIKLDIRVIEQRGAGPAVSRTVTMLVRDRHVGRMRRSGSVILEGRKFNATLYVEARPTVLDDGKIALGMSLEYLPKPESDTAAAGDARGNLTENLNVIMDPGKPMTITRASDPASDTQTTVEITATISK